MNIVSTRAPDSLAAGLPRSAIKRLNIAMQALGLGRLDDAEKNLDSLMQLHPEHPEVLRLYAGMMSLRGDYQAALGSMQQAIALRPNDAAYWSSLGSVLIEAMRLDDAIDALRRACELDPAYTTAWYNLGLAYIRCMRVDEATAALRRAVVQAPEMAINARAILGDMFRADGRLDDAIAEYRAVLALQAHAGAAWWGLADIKTQRFADADLEQLRQVMNHPGASHSDRVAMGYALAKALDDRGSYAEALAALGEAHRRMRAQKPWDASANTAHIDAILAMFTPPPSGAVDPHLGQEAIFIVSMPRSGSTLTEQVLASHSQVDGGGEVSDLPSVLVEESQRRGKSFPDFVADLAPEDWARMGRRYLERTVGWRRKGARFTDKMPSNWHYVGAIRAMLPGARIIVVRRDALETCLSCYRQQLAKSAYTNTFGDLAAAWHDFDRTTKHWQRLHPNHVHVNTYEEMVVDPHVKIRELLAFCDLPFEPACLESHKSDRKVHTPSATQVREPMRRDTARAHRYGALLDPLRAALGMVPFSDSAATS